MDMRKCATEILNGIGGIGNVEEVTHCFTRLRFVLKDPGKADKEKVRHLEGVIQVVEAGGEFQVVLGAKVDKVFEELLMLLQDNSDEESKKAGSGHGHAAHKKDAQRAEKKAEQEKHHSSNRININVDIKNNSGIGNFILQTVARMFTPLIPAIAASGLIKGLLTAAKMIAFKTAGVDISTNDTYILLFAASQIIFYFMPVFLGYTAAKALKCNEIIAMTIGAFLVYPQIDQIMQDVSTVTRIFGVPVVKGAWTIGESTKTFSYTESVIPILLAVFVLYWLEKALERIIPLILQIILVPGISLILMVPLTLCILGPVGIYIGNVIQWTYDSVIGFNAILGGALIGGLWSILVIFGAHRALLPVGLNDVAVSGRQNLLAFAGAANFAQGGASLGVLLKSKDQEMKGVAAPAVISAVLVGITEPAIYGCNLRLKKPMICAVLAGAVGGGIMGAGGVYGDAFANNGVLTVFTYAAFGMRQFLFYLAGIAIAFGGAAVLTYMIGIDEGAALVGELSYERAQDKNYPGNAGMTEEEILHRDIDITAPLEGHVIALRDVSDEAFASEQLGKGVAIIPEKGEVIAPADCTVTALYPTLHAIGLELDNGAQLLIHVGIDTVKLQGHFFKQCVKQGQHVIRGTKLLEFDRDGIRKAGFDLTTPIIVGNSDTFAKVTGYPGEHVGLMTMIIHIQR